MSKTVLVTGASGFIGSHLVDSLRADGLHVRSLVLENASQEFLKESDSEIIIGDLRDRASLKTACQGCDEVYHLAAISRHDANVPDDEYRAVNVEGTLNLLEIARESGARRLLFTATIEAVGMSKDGAPLTEETPQHPRNIYGETKLEAENLVRQFQRDTGFETVVVRPPMTYGPRELILYTRLFNIIRKGFYPLIGSGTALSEFCYVKNQVHGIRLAMEKGRPGEVYFISDEESYTIEHIIRSIAAEMGVKVRTPHIPVPIAWCMGLGLEILSKILPFYPFRIPQTGRPPFSRKTVEWTSQSCLYCDISKAKTELGYKPEYSLQEGIRETIEWYRKEGVMR
jgi:nucleoside-diphosphate-sugar epimerase